MASLAIKHVFGFLRFFWFTGPLFDKELRISSRRRRNYYLRFAYILLLIVFVAGTWQSYDYLNSSGAYQKSRLAEIGKSIVVTIVIFQFFAAQILAIILLSNSISDEIYHRTLGVLMTTPINSLQIVIGKLFSKMLQILILLAISLPILAIIRVFGGVAWNYIISSFFITLCAAIFAGSVSLAFSIKNVHTYVVIIKTVFTLGVVYVLIPLIIAAIVGQEWTHILAFGNPIGNYPLLVAILHLNPLGMIGINTIVMLSPAITMPFNSWIIHCVIMIIASTIILAFSVKVVRKVALKQILGQLDLFTKFRLSFSGNKKNILREYEGSTRAVKGPPVLWKELRKPLIQGIDRTNNKIGLFVAIATQIITYYVCYVNNCLTEGFVHFLYVIVFIVIGTIFNIVLSVSCITSEKESRSWQILLTTSLDDWSIIKGKALGVFFKCLPVWTLMAGHIVLFILIGYINPIVFIQILIVVTGLIVFVTGFGVYLSSCFKKTTWGIIISFSLLIIAWMLVPLIIGIATEFFGNREMYAKSLGLYYSLNPVVQTGVIMDAAGGARYSDIKITDLSYQWPNLSSIPNIRNAYPTTKLLVKIMLIYSCFGIFFAWRAKKRIRRNIV